ncbi:MAG: hypothetical protein WCY19_00500 [Candidatus Gastranaerophilaceae bacterium]
MKINLIETLPKRLKPIAKFIAMQESDKELAMTRLGQDIATNWVPKMPFARTFADAADVTTMEFSENIWVYFGPKLIGEKLFRKLYSKKLDKTLQKMVSTTAEQLLNEKNEHARTLMPIKAAIAISALAIPLGEYALSFAKNIFTLKVFKQSDFNNIANLDKKNKVKKETPEQQKRVKDSAKKHIKLAGGLFAGCLALSALLATRGKNSKFLNTISEALLAPGNKIFRKNIKRATSFNKYFSLDFANNNGKLGLSRGQLTACVVAGFFGYTGAAKDRGKQNMLEVLFRYPLVGFYVITGSEMFEKGFKSILKRKSSYKNIIGKNLEVPKLSQLSDLAEKLAAQKGTTVESEFKRLFKQKSTIVLAPFLFSIGFMGLFVAGVSRYFTQYRYNKEKAGRLEG